MTTKRTFEDFTFHHIAALVTLVLVATWGVSTTWIHLTTLGGMDETEMVFLLILTPLYLVLLPLYWKRFRWAYLCGVLAILGLFAGAVLEAIDRVLIFSWSFYNVSVAVAFVAGAACIYFSTRSYLERPGIGLVKTILGVGGFAVIAAVIGVIISMNASAIRLPTVMNTLSRDT